MVIRNLNPFGDSTGMAVYNISTEGKCVMLRSMIN
jgi:hypothetical protein